MEAELMREPWQFPPRDTASCSAATPRRQQQHQQRLPNNLEDVAVAAVTAPNGGIGGGLYQPSASEPMSNWEENFQDLSGWCVTNARCDFRAGEPATATTELTESIFPDNEGNILVTGMNSTGIQGAMTQNFGKKTNTPSMRDATLRRSNVASRVVPSQQQQQLNHHYQHHPHHNRHLDHAYPMVLAGLQSSSINSNQQQQNHLQFDNSLSAKDRGVTLINDPNAWMATKIKPEIDPLSKNDNGNGENNSAASALWQELGDLGVCAAATGLPLSQQNLVVRDTQDVFEPDAANFDLLSYLCEDDVPSPVDSASTDSSRVTCTDANSLPPLPPNSSPHMIVSPHTYEPVSMGSPTIPSSSDSKQQQQQQLLRVRDLETSPLMRKLSPASTSNSSTDVAGISPHTSTRQLRGIVKVEKPDSPIAESLTATRRSARSKRPRKDSTASSSTTITSTYRGRGRKRLLELYDDEDDEDDEEDDSELEGQQSGNEVYRETREKNNEASRKSRMNKKAKEMEMSRRAIDLEKDNRILKMKVEELEKLVTSMRNAILRSALKREVKTNNMF